MGQEHKRGKSGQGLRSEFIGSKSGRGSWQMLVGLILCKSGISGKPVSQSLKFCFSVSVCMRLPTEYASVPFQTTVLSQAHSRLRDKIVLSSGKFERPAQCISLFIFSLLSYYYYHHIRVHENSLIAL